MHFHGIFHEEALAFFFVLSAIMAWQKPNASGFVFSNHNIFGFALLGIAVALRLYYAVVLLFFVTIQADTISNYFNLARLKSNFYEEFKRGTLATICLLGPSILWFFHTQHRVGSGADSIDIFKGRIYWESLFELHNYLAITNWIIKTHISGFSLLAASILALIAIRNPRPTRDALTLIVPAVACSVIILPTILHSAAHHDYYIFPTIVLLQLAFLIYYPRRVGISTTPAILTKLT